MKRLTVALAATVLLTGCGSNQPTATSTPTPTPTVTTPPSAQRYQTVVTLRDAAVAAGLPCPAWVQDNVVLAAAESASCSDDSVLSTYATDADLQLAVNNMQDMNEMLKDKNIPSDPLLIGPNWIINAPTADKLAPGLGGTVER